MDAPNPSRALLGRLLERRLVGQLARHTGPRACIFDPGRCCIAVARTTRVV
jgi:hypothetical protein